MNETHKNRRQFLRVAGGAAAGVLGASLLGCKADGKSLDAAAQPAAISVSQRRNPGGATVVIARDPGMWHGDTLDGGRVKALVLHALREFTGEESDARAWGRFFKAGDRVGVKVNCLAGRRLSTTPELCGGIAAGLRSAGIKEGNIIFFDRTGREMELAGFTLETNRDSIKYVGTDAQGVGYEKDLSLYGEVGSRVSRIVSRYSTALISASVLKDHDLAGISGCMKNYYGAINNPNKLHLNNCDPYVADCFSLPEFVNKTRLCICDGTLAQYHAGPGYKPVYAWKYSGVLVSDDPVALDAVCLDIIEKKRAEQGLPTLEQEGRPARYIATAGDDTHRLGVADLSAVTVKTLSV